MDTDMHEELLTVVLGQFLQPVLVVLQFGGLRDREAVLGGDVLLDGRFGLVGIGWNSGGLVGAAGPHVGYFYIKYW